VRKPRPGLFELKTENVLDEDPEEFNKLGKEGLPAEIYSREEHPIVKSQ
jgi:hypothetical protein